MKLFEMRHIKKSFGELEVLKDISLQVKEGEVLSIIGPSGSGKSTLLRCATGLETPDSGEIIKEGEVGLVFPLFCSEKHCGRSHKSAEAEKRRGLRTGERASEKNGTLR